MISQYIQHAFSTVQVHIGGDCQRKIFQGIQLLNQATKITLGPKKQNHLSQQGLNVVIDNELGLPRITKDGVTVAQNIMFVNQRQQKSILENLLKIAQRDQFMEIGASLLRKSSGNTNLFAGDGTTTSTLIASQIIEEGMKYYSVNINPIQMKRGIDKGVALAIEFFQQIAKIPDTEQQLFDVAMVSTNYDQNLSEVISQALWKVGLNGLIEIQPGNSVETHLVVTKYIIKRSNSDFIIIPHKFTQGVGINRGYASNQFLFLSHTSPKSIPSMVMENPYIMIINKEITQIRQIASILDQNLNVVTQKVKPTRRPLLFIVKDMKAEVISNLIFNQQQGIIEVCVMTTPGMGNYTDLVLDDLSLITGARLFTADQEQDIIESDLSDLGQAFQVSLAELESFITGGNGQQQNIEERVSSLERELSKAQSDSAIKIIKDRLGRITGNLALILCGGNSEVAMKQNYDKLVDGLNAVKLALKSGFVPGGGASYINAAKLLDNIEVNSYDQKCGINVLKSALNTPMRQVIENSGQNGQEKINTLLQKYGNDFRMGYDLKQGMQSTPYFINQFFYYLHQTNLSICSKLEQLIRQMSLKTL